MWNVIKMIYDEYESVPKGEVKFKLGKEIESSKLSLIKSGEFRKLSEWKEHLRNMLLRLPMTTRPAGEQWSAYISSVSFIKIA